MGTGASAPVASGSTWPAHPDCVYSASILVSTTCQAQARANDTALMDPVLKVYNLVRKACN